MEYDLAICQCLKVYTSEQFNKILSHVLRILNRLHLCNKKSGVYKLAHLAAKKYI